MRPIRKASRARGGFAAFPCPHFRRNYVGCRRSPPGRQRRLVNLLHRLDRIRARRRAGRWRAGTGLAASGPRWAVREIGGDEPLRQRGVPRERRRPRAVIGRCSPKHSHLELQSCRPPGPFLNRKTPGSKLPLPTKRRFPTQRQCAKWIRAVRPARERRGRLRSLGGSGERRAVEIDADSQRRPSDGRRNPPRDDNRRRSSRKTGLRAGQSQKPRPDRGIISLMNAVTRPQNDSIGDANWPGTPGRTVQNVNRTFVEATADAPLGEGDPFESRSSPIPAPSRRDTSILI